MTTAVQRNTTASDYLNNLRIQQQATIAGNKAQTDWTPNYVLGLLDTLNVTDTLSQPTSVTPATFLVNGDAAYKNFWLQFAYDLNDYSGNANNGTVNGTTTFSTSPIIQNNVLDASFSFDGSTNITVPSTAAITGSNDRTISLFINPSTFADGKRIFEYGVAGTDTLFSIQYSGTSGLIKFYDGTSTITSTAKLNANFWNWICITIGSTGTAFNLYINSTTVDTSQSITALNTTSSTIFIGSDVSSGNNLPNNTLIDEIQLLNFVASSSERTSLASNQQFSHNATVTVPSFVSECDCA